MVAATVLGYSIAKSAALERLLSPYIVASQAIPIVAIAPAAGDLVWARAVLEGPDRALIVFFPVLVNTVVGVRAVPQDLHDLMRSPAASLAGRPSLRLGDSGCAAVLLGGLKIGATLSVIGAVVGEFVGADKGLGFLVNAAAGSTIPPWSSSPSSCLIAMALALHGLVAWFERRLAWRTEAEP